VKARQYQLDAHQAVLKTLGTHKSCLCVMPTGTGKTVLFTLIADQWEHGDVLILAHREELVLQPANTIEAVTGLRPAIEMGEMRADNEGNWWGMHPRIVVASKDSLHPARLRRFSQSRFGLIVIDEAHRSAKHNRTYSHILEYFSDAKVLGVTATPDRRDKASIVGSTFEALAYEYKLDRAIKDGYLCPIRQQIVTVHGLDFSEVKKLAGDFSDSDLDRILNEESMLHKMVAPTMDIVKERPTIVFCATIAHAEAMSEMINRYKQDSAVVVTGKTEKADRHRLIESFKKGEKQFLCGCDVFTEGFDCPPIAAVVVCRPTKSRGRYVQMIGRGTRPIVPVTHETPEERRQAIAESGKNDCLVLDYVGCSNDLKLMVNVADIVADAVEIECTPKQKEEAIQKAKSRADGTLDMQEAIEEEINSVLEKERSEKQRIEEFKKRQADRRREIRAKEAQYSLRENNGFDNSDRSSNNTLYVGRSRPASDKQKRMLIAFGVDPSLVASYTIAEAGSSISYLKQVGRKQDWTRLRGVKV